GIAFLLVGFGFKVAIVPFHMWAPDVYDGAPSAITAYMAATVKAAAFAAFLRVWLEAFPNVYAVWHSAIAGLAIATMIAGNAGGPCGPMRKCAPPIRAAWVAARCRRRSLRHVPCFAARAAASYAANDTRGRAGTDDRHVRWLPPVRHHRDLHAACQRERCAIAA